MLKNSIRNVDCNLAMLAYIYKLRSYHVYSKILFKFLLFLWAFIYGIGGISFSVYAQDNNDVAIFFAPNNNSTGSINYPLWWSAGLLNYDYGGAELAAFVNTKEHAQLQFVLCSKGEVASYRFTVLLEKDPHASGLVPAKFYLDGEATNVYAEIVGNSLEFQVGSAYLINLPDASSFAIEFSQDDANFLNIPKKIVFSMDNIASTIKEVAYSCTVLCDKKGFNCNMPLISGLLWPRHGFLLEQENKEPKSKVYTNLISSLLKESDYQSSALEVENTDYISRETLDKYCLYYPEQAKDLKKQLASILSSTTQTNYQTKDHQYHYRASQLKTWARGISLPSFVLTPKCKLLLDNLYDSQIKFTLPFFKSLFFNLTGNYVRYQNLWNEAVKFSHSMDFNTNFTYANDYEYYLILYTLLSDSSLPLRQYPQSYYEILRFREDPSSFLYTMDNRYELETVKYTSVLMRRLNSSTLAQRNVEQALNAWHEFYNELSLLLPPIPKAQALRPIIYRHMLMRIWRLSGKPQALHLLPEYNVGQGTNGKTSTQEFLEAKCAVFEGSRGDEFFFASEDCVKTIHNDIRNLGLLNQDYQEVSDNWDKFAQAWMNSVFYKEDAQDAVGEHLRSSLALTLLSMYKTYGFGDYFLLRKCLLSRDSDICNYEAFKSHANYVNDLRKSVSTIAQISKEDAKTLSDLSVLWQNYYDSLCKYTNNLALKGRIAAWRAYFVQGVASISQAEAVLNSMFYRQGALDLQELQALPDEIEIQDIPISTPIVDEDLFGIDDSSYVE